MKYVIKTAVLGMVFTLTLIGDLQLTPTLRVGMFSEAQAIAGVRRRTARRTAVVVSSADAAAYSAAAASTAAASSAAAASTPPPAAAPAPAPVAAAPGALPLGTVVNALPQGCTAEAKGGVEYQHCGPDYYRAVFQANNLVYVTTQP